MATKPWRFTIVFDEEKAKRNGYNVDDLYDCVGEYATSSLVSPCLRAFPCTLTNAVILSSPISIPV